MPIPRGSTLITSRVLKESLGSRVHCVSPQLNRSRVFRSIAFCAGRGVLPLVLVGRAAPQVSCAFRREARGRGGSSPPSLWAISGLTARRKKKKKQNKQKGQKGGASFWGVLLERGRKDAAAQRGCAPRGGRSPGRAGPRGGGDVEPAGPGLPRRTCAAPGVERAGRC